MNDYIPEQRAGSFLPICIPFRAYERDSKKERLMIEQQLQDFELKLRNFLITAKMLCVYEKQMERLRQGNINWDRGELYELLVIQLLDNLKNRGKIKWHMWYKACPNGDYIDRELGVDHFGDLADEWRGIRFLINTKSSNGGVENHQKKVTAAYILGYYPMCPLGTSEELLSQEADRLFSEIVSFFGSRNGNGRKNGGS